MRGFGISGFLFLVSEFALFIVVLFVILLSGFAEKELEGSSTIVMAAGEKTVAAYRDGESVTDEMLAFKEQTETAVISFFLEIQ